MLNRGEEGVYLPLPPSLPPSLPPCSFKDQPTHLSTLILLGRGGVLARELGGEQQTHL